MNISLKQLSQKAKRNNIGIRESSNKRLNRSNAQEALTNSKVGNKINTQEMNIFKQHKLSLSSNIFSQIKEVKTRNRDDVIPLVRNTKLGSFMAENKSLDLGQTYLESSGMVCRSQPKGAFVRNRRRQNINSFEIGSLQNSKNNSIQNSIIGSNSRNSSLNASKNIRKNAIDMSKIKKERLSSSRDKNQKKTTLFNLLNQNTKQTPHKIIRKVNSHIKSPEFLLPFYQGSKKKVKDQLHADNPLKSHVIKNQVISKSMGLNFNHLPLKSSASFFNSRIQRKDDIERSNMSKESSNRVKNYSEDFRKPNGLKRKQLLTIFTSSSSTGLLTDKSFGKKVVIRNEKQLHPSQSTVNVHEDLFYRQNTKPKTPEPVPTFLWTSRTKKGSNPENPSKKNQDRALLITNFMGTDGFHIFGVFDGHGFFEDQFLRVVWREDIFPKILQQEILLTEGNNRAFEEIIFFSFDKLVKGLSNSGIDTAMSGSTCNLCIIRSNMLYVTNIGDSRSVLAYTDSNNKLKTKALSFDHKPENENEKARILKHGGRIQPLIDAFGRKCGPMRVWLKNQQLPGLAMTRSIGDSIAAPAGVTWKPEIAIYKLGGQDKAITVASDGVWDALTDSEVVRYMSQYFGKGDIEACADMILHQCVIKWNKENMMDDITFVTVFLNIQQNHNTLNAQYCRNPTYFNFQAIWRSFNLEFWDPQYFKLHYFN